MSRPTKHHTHKKKTNSRNNVELDRKDVTTRNIKRSKHKGRH